MFPNVREKVNILKTHCCPEIKTLVCNLPDIATMEDNNDYQKLRRKWNNHFLPKENKHPVRYTSSK